MKKLGLPAKRQDRIYTFGDYKNWPEDERWELINGVAWNMSAAPNRFHQGLLSELSRQVFNELLDKPCLGYVAPFDVLLPDSESQNEEEIDTVVQPDISVICDKTKLTDKGCTGAPDWIVEILSPTTSHKDLRIKLQLYERHGVREYWIVDPGNKFVHVYVLDTYGKYPLDPELYIKEQFIECRAIPGLKIDLVKLFNAE